MNTRKSPHGNQVQSRCITGAVHRYIELRTKAKSDFEKDFLKSINSSVFGETMENVRKHQDFS